MIHHVMHHAASYPSTSYFTCLLCFVDVCFLLLVANTSSHCVRPCKVCFWDMSAKGAQARSAVLQGHVNMMSAHDTKCCVLDSDGLVLFVDFGLQVIAHTHYLPRVNGSMGKRVLPMSLHRYNWDLPRPSNTSQPYFACNSFGANCTQLRVLAFSPSVEVLLASSASWHEFAFLLQGLAALATTLGRAVAWPSLPCNTSWISRSAFWLPPRDRDMMLCSYTAHAL